MGRLKVHLKTLLFAAIFGAIAYGFMMAGIAVHRLLL